METASVSSGNVVTASPAAVVPLDTSRHERLPESRYPGVMWITPGGHPQLNTPSGRKVVFTYSANSYEVVSVETAPQKVTMLYAPNYGERESRRYDTCWPYVLWTFIAYRNMSPKVLVSAMKGPFAEQEMETQLYVLPVPNQTVPELCIGGDGKANIYSNIHWRWQIDRMLGQILGSGWNHDLNGTMEFERALSASPGDYVEAFENWEEMYKQDGIDGWRKLKLNYMSFERGRFVDFIRMYLDINISSIKTAMSPLSCSLQDCIGDSPVFTPGAKAPELKREFAPILLPADGKIPDNHARCNCGSLFDKGSAPFVFERCRNCSLYLRNTNYAVKRCNTCNKVLLNGYTNTNRTTCVSCYVTEVLAKVTAKKKSFAEKYATQLLEGGKQCLGCLELYYPKTVDNRWCERCNAAARDRVIAVCESQLLPAVISGGNYVRIYAYNATRGDCRLCGHVSIDPADNGFMNGLCPHCAGYLQYDPYVGNIRTLRGINANNFTGKLALCHGCHGVLLHEGANSLYSGYLREANSALLCRECAVHASKLEMAGKARAHRRLCLDCMVPVDADSPEQYCPEHIKYARNGTSRLECDLCGYELYKGKHISKKTVNGNRTSHICFGCSERLATGESSRYICDTCGIACTDVIKRDDGSATCLSCARRAAGYVPCYGCGVSCPPGRYVSREVEEISGNVKLCLSCAPTWVYVPPEEDEDYEEENDDDYDEDEDVEDEEDNG